MVTLRFALTPATVDALNRPVVGQGGFQGLLRQVQDLLSGNELTLTPELVGKIVRYVQDYGQGGFQGRLDLILHELKSLGAALRPLSDCRRLASIQER